MPRRPKPARSGPKPRAGDVADQRLEIRVTAAELAAYRDHAEGLGETLSDWIRTACDDRLGEDSPRPERVAVTKLVQELRAVLDKHDVDDI